MCFENENAGDVDCERERKARVFQERLFTQVVQDCIEIVKIYSPQIEEIKKSSYVWISITASFIFKRTNYFFINSNLYT